MPESLSAQLEESVSAFVRGFGLLDCERTPCGLDLHLSEAHLVGDLHRVGPLSQRDLSQRLHLAKSTVSRLVSQLVARGWVERRASPSDGRTVLVALTPNGDEVAKRLTRARGRRFDSLLAAIPSERRHEAMRALAELARAASSSSECAA